ncbi:MAG: DUF2846 domain-containing protein [Bacteroidota bacterium]
MKLSSKFVMLSVIVFCSFTAVAQDFQPVKEIPAGKALVYIYRTSSIVGAAVSYSINANQVKVSEARLKNGTYMVYFADPGKIMFWGQVINYRKEVTLEVEAGKTYYIKGDCCELKIPKLEKALKQIVNCELARP